MAKRLSASPSRDGYKKIPGVLIVAPWKVTAQGGVNGVIRHLASQMSRAGRYRPVILQNEWTARAPKWDAAHEPLTGSLRLRSPLAEHEATIVSLARFLWTMPALAYRIIQIISLYDVRVINLHCLSLNYFIFIILKRLYLFRGSIVVSCHGSDVYGNLGARGIKRVVFRSILRNADVVVAVSNSLETTISKCLDDKKVHSKTIYNGVDFNIFRGVHQEAPAVVKPSASKIIICVASFDLKKGVDILIHAFSTMMHERPDTRLLLVGESSAHDQVFMSLVDELGMNSRVEWRRDVPADAVAALLSTADLFVLASRDEGGIALSLLEAGALALPVVATRVGGIPELIENGTNGLLVEPENPQALAAAMARLLDDPAEAAAMGANLQRVVVGSFTWERMYQRYEAVIGRLAAK